MATGGVLEDLEGSSEVDERPYTCSLCENVNPSHFCPLCDVYYCKACLVNVCDHGVLGRSDIHKWGKGRESVADDSSGSESWPNEEECHWHPGQQLYAYCDKHDAVCCVTCVELEHSSCGEAVRDIKFIPEIHQAAEKEGRKLKQDLKNLYKQIETFENLQIAQRTKLFERRKIYQEKLYKYKQNINAKLDDLGCISNRFIDNCVSDNESRLHANRQACDGLRTSLKQICTTISKAENSPSKLFACVKKNRQIFVKNNQMLRDIQSQRVYDRFDHTFLPDIESTLDSLDGLCKMTLLDCPYIVRNKHTVHLDRIKNESDFVVKDICLTQDGHVIISNGWILKQLDETYKYINEKNISNETIACNVNNIAVLTQNSAYAILEVYFANNLRKIYDFLAIFVKINYQFGNTPRYSLACIADKVLVSDTDKKSILEFDGKRQRVKKRTIYKGQEIYDIFFNRDGSRIYVLDKDKGLVSLDKDGKVLSTYWMHHLGFFSYNQHRSRLCVDYGGNIFVSTHRSIVQVSVSGDQMISEIPYSAHGIDQPTAICFDGRKSKLILGTTTPNQITVLELEQQSH